MLAIAAASASAVPPPAKHAHARASQNASSQNASNQDASSQAAAATPQPQRAAGRRSSASTPRRSKAYSTGFQQGFAAGRAAALRNAVGARCSASAAHRAAVAPTPAAIRSQRTSSPIAHSAAPPATDDAFDSAPAENASRKSSKSDATFCRAEGSSEVVPCAKLHSQRCSSGNCVQASQNQASPDLDDPFSDPAAASSAPAANKRSAPKELASLRIKPGVMPPPLRGSSDSLERQNDRLDAEGLERIEDERDLTARIARKLLVPIPASAALDVNPNLPNHRRYCRPWTARFLADISRAHQSAFHKPLRVSSAVRTVEYQKRLMETNGNAAPAEGDVVSPHLTGAAIDIPKDGFTKQEIAWMRTRLLALQQAGKIDVAEEFQQSCFHIVVYRSYMPALPDAHPGSKPSAPRGATQRTTAKASPADTARRPAARTELASAPATVRPVPIPQPMTSTNYSKPRPHAARPMNPAPASAQPLQVVVEGQ
ncbi:MAG: DUF5715 family protein [Terracidiphilus sp.]|nr:DUF5715 family protein [Terracidiphilus sp.]